MGDPYGLSESDEKEAGYLTLSAFAQIVGIDIHADPMAVGCGHGSVFDDYLVPVDSQGKSPVNPLYS